MGGANSTMPLSSPMAVIICFLRPTVPKSQQKLRCLNTSGLPKCCRAAWRILCICALKLNECIGALQGYSAWVPWNGNSQMSCMGAMQPASNYYCMSPWLHNVLAYEKYLLCDIKLDQRYPKHFLLALWTLPCVAWHWDAPGVPSLMSQNPLGMFLLWHLLAHSWWYTLPVGSLMPKAAACTHLLSIAPKWKLAGRFH